MLINVQARNGPLIANMHVRLGETVGDVKYKIHDREGIPSEQQRLRFHGKKMFDGNQLSTYNVQHGSTLRFAAQKG